ncbi:MAG: hypothetical protein WC817_01700 [Patescibacteria group bacterium]|jgi:hypothetical protein
MANLSTALRTGNLTARERFLLLIQNDIQRMKTGKDILTTADKAALENWQAKNNVEASEWNRLNEGWKHTGRMDIEVEFAYQEANAAHLAKLPIIIELLTYRADREMSRCINVLKRLKKVNPKEASVIIAKQKAAKLKEGIDVEYAVYRLAFERLTPAEQQQMKELYGDVETDHQYLDQEEVIANLYGNQTELTPEAKDKLATLVAERSYNAFAKEHQLFHYFACIPLAEVARYFIALKNIILPSESSPADGKEKDPFADLNQCNELAEALQTYATTHHTTVEKLLTEACRVWLDDGLLETYTPLVTSNNAALFERWLAAKIEAKTVITQHVSAGELMLRHRTEEETRKEKLLSKDSYDRELATAQAVLEEIGREATIKGELDEKSAFETFADQVITGESLYAFPGDYEFVKSFKERADIYDPNLGIVYADDDPNHAGEHLDQELLICDITDSGDASVFSRYGMAISLLANIFDKKMFFEEVAEDGKLFLHFKDSQIEEAFRARQQNLVDGYAKLLAYQAVFSKVAAIYEADLAYHVTERLTGLRENITQHNEAVQQATNLGERLHRKAKYDFFRRRDRLYLKEDLVINIDTIKPDQATMKEHEAKLKRIFGNF